MSVTATTELWVFIGGGLLLGAALLELAYGVYRHGIGPTPSGLAAREALAEMCCDETRRGREYNPAGPLTIYELGSGWGGLSLKIARALSRAPHSDAQSVRVVGYEVTFTPYLTSALSALILRAIHQSVDLEFRRADLICGLSAVQRGDLCVCYLCPAQMERIADYIEATRTLPPFTLISLTFALPNVTPSARYVLPTLYRDPIYVYEIS